MNNKKNVHILSNTHWDREWYMSLEKYRVRLVKMMDRLITIMEAKQTYQFMADGQYMMIKDYLDVKPEMTERVSKLVVEGRLHVGPWYTQPLETLITGEGMVRNLLYGIKESEKLGGAMRFSYMIDEFGHASQTPQILKGFDIDHAMAWRGMKRNIPDTFEWIAPEGSSVSMYYSRHGYGEATAMPREIEDFEENIDGHIFKRAGLKTRIAGIKRLKEINPLTNQYFWLNGIDHSWGQEDILEVVDIINEAFPEYNAKQSTPMCYAEAYMKECKENNVILEKHVGELIDPYEATLQSTHTARVDQKIEHYKSERILEKKAEPLATIGWLCNLEYPTWALDRAWVNILENHAHDSLGCTSIDSVYKQVMARYDNSIALSEQIIRDSATFLMSLDEMAESLYLFNTTGVAYKGDIYARFLMTSELKIEKFKIVDEKGEDVVFNILDRQQVRDIRYNPQYGHPSQITSEEYSIIMNVNIEASIGIKRFKIVKLSKEEGTFSLNAYDVISGSRKNDKGTLTPAFGIMENNTIKVEINYNGTLNLLYKETGKCYRNMLLIEDSGDNGNFYIHTRPYYNKLITNLGCQAEINLIYDESLYCEYEVKYNLNIPKGCEGERRSDITIPTPVVIHVKLLRDNPTLDVTIEIDNKSTDHQMRMLFPTELLKATYSRSGQAFDIVKRPIQVALDRDIKNNPSYACYPMQDFCDISEVSNGLTIAAKGLYEYEAIENRENTLAVTLFRSTEYIDRGSFSYLGQFDSTMGKLIRTLKFDISLIPHNGNFTATYKQVMNYIAPPTVLFNMSTDEKMLREYEKPQKVLSANTEFVKMKGNNCIITCLKKAEKRESFIIRVWNYSDIKENITLQIPTEHATIKSIYRVNYNEDRKEMIAEGNEVSIELVPSRVIALEFEISRVGDVSI